MSLSRRLRALALVLGVAFAAAVAGGPADAVEAPPGSKNFSPPGYVPNYFSNESGPFQGGANTRNAQSETAPIVAAPGSRDRVAAASRRNSRHHAGRLAKAKGRTRLAHAGAAHGAKAAGAKTAHAQVKPVAGKAVAAKRAASSKGKRIARAHG
jgi:hypothetical protein